MNYTEGGYSTDFVFIAGVGNKAITETNSPADFATVFGFGNITKATNFVCGMFCKTPNPTTDPFYSGSKRGDLFVIGNGTGTRDDNYNVTATTRSNAFRVACDGGVYGTKSYTASGADYAEMFEWADCNPNNEDRRGLFVTLDGEKIRPASADDVTYWALFRQRPLLLRTLKRTIGERNGKPMFSGKGCLTKTAHGF